MTGLRFLADMNISPLTVRDLDRMGWEITRVSDVMDEKASDAEILAYARARDQIVVTQGLDFSALLAVGGHAKPTVITLRLQDARPSLVTARLVDLVSAMGHELARGVVVSVDEASARFRLLPISSEGD